MLKQYDIVVDLENELYTPSNILFEASRNDLESIQLNLIIQLEGQVVDLTGQTVELAIKKPSGLTVYQETEIPDPRSGKAEVLLSIQAYIEYGIYQAEIYVRNADQLLVSCPFWYKANEAIMTTEEVDSVNDWSALQMALFNYDKKPILVDGIPTQVPEYVGQTAFDITGKRSFQASDLTPDSWILLGSQGGGGIVSWADIIGKPDSFPPSAHTHSIADLTDLPDWLTIEEADLRYLTAIPPEYLTQGEADALYQPKGTSGTASSVDWGKITGSIADQADLETALGLKLEADDLTWTAITGKPTTFPPSAHTHAWTEITAKPTTFPPTAHTHLWADITDKPTVFASDWASVANKPTAFTPTAHTHPWTDITGKPTTFASDWASVANKPATFPPSAHTHLWADITDKPTSFASDWGTIANKPATFPPEAHIHAIADITDLQATLDAKADDSDLAAKADLENVYTKADVYNKGETYNKTEIDQMTMGAGGGSPVIVEDNLSSTSTTNALSANQGRILQNSKAPTVHTHVWADITDKPTSFPVAWADVSGKPTTFPPSAHTHVWADLTDKPTTFASDWGIVANKPTTFPPSAHTHVWADLTDKPTIFPTNWANVADIPTEFPPEAHTHVWADITDKPTTFPPSAHTHLWADITDKPTSFPSDWGTITNIPATFPPSAHTHPWADITGKPTTFSPPLMSGAVVGGAQVGNGLAMSGNYLYVKTGNSLGINTGTNALQLQDQNGTGLTIWRGTQAQYNALTPDANTLYFISG